MLDKVRVLDSNLLVEPITEQEETKTASGIFVTTGSVTRMRGRVVKVGSGYVSNGTNIPLDVKVGETVYYTKYQVRDIMIDNVNYHIVDYSDILYVINQ